MRLSSDMKILIIWSVMMTLDAQLVCWQALVRCHEERECELAYNQYLSACDGIIRGERRQCPSHCISALIRLNQTGSGPDLERCSCETDAECLSAKRAIDPCLPRTYPSGADSMGCTEARRRCEDDPACYAALMAYLSHCGQLFNGRRCSPQCRDTIEDLLRMPNGVALNTCVCDGLERPFCEVVKQNMVKLCLIGDPGGEQDDAYEDEDYEAKPGSEASDAVMSSSGAAALSRRVALLLVLAALQTL